MTTPPNVSTTVRACPFCGVATSVPHETQEGCIAALHVEIDRMRSILSTLRPAGVVDCRGDTEDRPERLALYLE